MPCLKVLLAPGKQCVVVLGQGPGSQQLSLLPSWAMRCTGSWVQAGGQGHSAGRNFSNCLGSSCCQGSLGTHWETWGSGNGLQVWLISLCTSGVLPVWGGFSIPATAAPFAFIHVVSYVRVFFLRHYNWQMWICCTFLVPIRDIALGWGSNAIPRTGCMGWAHLPPWWASVVVPLVLHWPTTGLSCCVLLLWVSFHCPPAVFLVNGLPC